MQVITTIGLDIAKSVFLRTILCALSFALIAYGGQAQTQKNAAFLIKECRPLTALNGEPDPNALSRANPNDLISISYCIGFLEALITSLERLHSLYDADFPDPSKLRTDETTAKRYIATVLLVGPDVCFPEGITPKIAAMIIEKYGKEHPEQLTDHPQKFANLAFASAYPSIVNGVRQCK
jgi:Rap1a immunity proteins